MMETRSNLEVDLENLLSNGKPIMKADIHDKVACGGWGFSKLFG